jgi:hypothetical protein
MNQQVYILIEDACWAQLELDPKFKEALALRNRAIDTIKGKADIAAIRVLEDAFFDGGRIIGRAMFELGLQLGRDPNSIWTLPETDGPAIWWTMAVRHERRSTRPRVARPGPRRGHTVADATRHDCLL